MSTRELEIILETVRTWILGVDQKISIGLVLVVATISILVTPTYDLLIVVKMSTMSSIFLISSVVVFLYSLIKLLMAVSPRTALVHKNSLIYFGTIPKFTSNEYKKRISKISSKEYKNELVDQIYITSEICNKKHSHYKDALYVFILGLISWLGFLTAVLWARNG